MSVFFLSVTNVCVCLSVCGGFVGWRRLAHPSIHRWTWVLLCTTETLRLPALTQDHLHLPALTQDHLLTPPPSCVYPGASAKAPDLPEPPGLDSDHRRSRPGHARVRPDARVAHRPQDQPAATPPPRAAPSPAIATAQKRKQKSADGAGRRLGDGVARGVGRRGGGGGGRGKGWGGGEHVVPGVDRCRYVLRLAALYILMPFTRMTQIVCEDSSRYVLRLAACL